MIRIFFYFVCKKKILIKGSNLNTIFYPCREYYNLLMQFVTHESSHSRVQGEKYTNSSSGLVSEF